MQREAVTPRQDWEDLHTRFRFGEGKTIRQPASWVESSNWHENACYCLTTREADMVAEATRDLHAMCLETAGNIIKSGNYGDELGIPAAAIPAIERSWNCGDPSVYGRFDLAFDGVNPPKMLEYNADIADQLLESSVLQYHWAIANNKPRFFNNIHGNLAHRWDEIKGQLAIDTIHFTADFRVTENIQTLDYMKLVAEESGLTVKIVDITKIGWDDAQKKFYDPADDQDINHLFKLYPWEEMVTEAFGAHLVADPEPVHMIEPSWKMLLTSKGFMAALWKDNENHPNLLPTFKTVASFGTTFVKKPFWGAGGKDVEIHINDIMGRGANSFKHGEGFIYQKYEPLPVFDGHSALTCSWVIGNNPSGIGIREQQGNIVNTKSAFVPHYIK
jgi:glutathionylspermidine synthase